ncbi:collagen alpha-1(XVIII) chain-like [Suncus etruscus]|uniref:collagen alpha-1(XVIII) chain-like n=1 Tax=Suncus etruscus TaxID=109475 RepID=UPI00210FB8E5|nr:collagen alpha-1(XVIII) chain-like [Suncus etruscus]
MVAFGVKLDAVPQDVHLLYPEPLLSLFRPRGVPGAERVQALGHALRGLHGGAVTLGAGLQLEPGAGLFLAQVGAHDFDKFQPETPFLFRGRSQS